MFVCYIEYVAVLCEGRLLDKLVELTEYVFKLDIPLAVCACKGADLCDLVKLGERIVFRDLIDLSSHALYLALEAYECIVKALDTELVAQRVRKLVLKLVDALKQLVDLVVYLIQLFLCRIRLTADEQIKNSAESRCKELAVLGEFLKNLEKCC